MFVCPQSPPPFTDRPAPDLAGIGGWGQVQNPAQGIGFRNFSANFDVVRSYTTLSVWAGESMCEPHWQKASKINPVHHHLFTTYFNEKRD